MLLRDSIGLGQSLSLTYLTIHLSSLLVPVKRRWGTFRDPAGKFRVRRLLAFILDPTRHCPIGTTCAIFAITRGGSFGRGPKPKFDRFTYWEKFDYFAELWGSAFIGISGLVMWFSVQVSRVLPGWVSKTWRKLCTVKKLYSPLFHIDVPLLQ